MANKRGVRPGTVNNPNGRPKGALNKRTVEHMSRASQLIERMENHPKFATMLDSLSEKEFAALYKDVLEYMEPKLARTEHTDGEGGPLVITVRHTLENGSMPVIEPQPTEDAEFKLIPIMPKKRPF